MKRNENFLTIEDKLLGTKLAVRVISQLDQQIK